MFEPYLLSIRTENNLHKTRQELFQSFKVTEKTDIMEIQAYLLLEAIKFHETWLNWDYSPYVDAVKEQFRLFNTRLVDAVVFVIPSRTTQTEITVLNSISDFKDDGIMVYLKWQVDVCEMMFTAFDADANTWFKFHTTPSHELEAKIDSLSSLSKEALIQEILKRDYSIVEIVPDML